MKTSGTYCYVVGTAEVFVCDVDTELTTRVLIGVKNGPLFKSPVRFKYSYRRPITRHPHRDLLSKSTNIRGSKSRYPQSGSGTLEILICGLSRTLQESPAHSRSSLKSITLPEEYRCRRSIAVEGEITFRSQVSQKNRPLSRRGNQELFKSRVFRQDYSRLQIRLSRRLGKPAYIPSGCPARNSGILLEDSLIL